MQLQLETGFDGHIINNRVVCKERKPFLFQKAIAQKNFYTRNVDFIIRISPEYLLAFFLKNLHVALSL